MKYLLALWRRWKHRHATYTPTGWRDWKQPRRWDTYGWRIDVDVRPLNDGDKPQDPR